MTVIIPGEKNRVGYTIEVPDYPNAVVKIERDKITVFSKRGELSLEFKRIL